MDCWTRALSAAGLLLQLDRTPVRDNSAQKHRDHAPSVRLNASRSSAELDGEGEFEGEGEGPVTWPSTETERVIHSRSSSAKRGSDGGKDSDTVDE